MREASASNIGKKELAGPGDSLHVGGFCHIKVRECSVFITGRMMQGTAFLKSGHEYRISVFLIRETCLGLSPLKGAGASPPPRWPQGWEAHPGPGPASFSEPCGSICLQWSSKHQHSRVRDMQCTQIDSLHHLGRFGWHTPNLCHRTAKRLIFNLPFLF